MVDVVLGLVAGLSFGGMAAVGNSEYTLGGGVGAGGGTT